ncbi:MAG: glycosyltransferase [Anaerolineales bacterium]|nr:glycosyltransferase [Anaerolineales bacterium]
MILVLFTASYPYVTGAEQNFLEVEIQHLAQSFERVILVPERRDGQRSDILPQIEVDDSYSDYLLSRTPISTLLNGGFSDLVYKEIISRPSLLIKPAYLERLLFFASQAERTRKWVAAWIKKQNINTNDCLFYTYWFDQATMGIGLLKTSFPDIKLVSRAHGYDIYEERRTPPYWPCREAALSSVDFLFPDSDAGTDYLQGKYPKFISRVETARLGILDSGIITNSSLDGIYRIVSCSRMVPVKRLDLIMQGIIAAAKRRPSQKFEWCHFGTGPLQADLEMKLKELPENVIVRFAGYSTQSNLFNYYRKNPVDVFMNVSVSEGTSVAIMEAVSCGIPVIATGVGGNTEIVSERNGHILSANPTADEVAAALLQHWEAPGERRVASRMIWQEQYNAGKNFSIFTQHLFKIRARDYRD